MWCKIDRLIVHVYEREKCFVNHVIFRDIIIQNTFFNYVNMKINKWSIYLFIYKYMYI